MAAQLLVEKSGSKWVVKVANGPSAGKQVGFPFDRKRDAVAYADGLAELPWSHLSTTAKTARLSTDLIVTITRTELRWLYSDLEHVQAELEAAKRVLLQVDGSALLMQEARAALAVESGQVA